jgi:hypothetical protein
MASLGQLSLQVPHPSHFSASTLTGMVFSLVELPTQNSIEDAGTIGHGYVSGSAIGETPIGGIEILENLKFPIWDFRFGFHRS